MPRRTETSDSRLSTDDATRAAVYGEAGGGVWVNVSAPAFGLYEGVGGGGGCIGPNGEVYDCWRGRGCGAGGVGWEGEAEGG